MATELADDIHWIDLGGVNAYLVDDDGVLTLIDAGTPGDADAIEAAIIDAGHAVEDVARVLVTHYDVDHVGGLAGLDLEATIHVGEADAAVLTGERTPPLRNHKGALQRVTRPLIGDLDLPIEVVDDGDRVGSFTAYHTPGHSPGHVTFVSERLDAGFLGDLVFEEDGELDASGWLMSYDTEAVAASVRDLNERVPDFSVLGMGHGIPFRRGGSDRLADCAAAIE